MVVSNDSASHDPPPQGFAVRAMRRWMAGAGMLILLLASIPAADAQSRAPTPEGQSRTEAAKAAEEALVAGILAMRHDNLLLAERFFHQALGADEGGSRVRDKATEELSYRLPLKRVERHLESEEWEQAERLLEDLRERHRSDQQKARQLDHLLARLRDGALHPDAVGAQAGDRRAVVRDIERTLEAFVEDNGRYPSGYEELNEILPSGEPPLIDYEIVHYTGNSRAYGLTLRNTVNPENLLTVQSTGLIE